MDKFITKDNLCYYKENGVVHSRNATPSEILSRDELKFELTQQGVIL